MTTWRVFPSEVEALNYCDLTWAKIIYDAPMGRIPPEYVAFKEALEQAVAAAGDLRSVPIDVIRAVSAVPLLGIDHLGNVVMGYGESRTWAVPEVTATGEFAVPCMDGFDAGGPPPPWPNQPTTITALEPVTSIVGQPVTVTIIGTGFNALTVVHVDGAPLPTVYVDAETLTVSGTPIVDGSAEVTTVNGTSVSNALTYTVTLA